MAVKIGYVSLYSVWEVKVTLLMCQHMARFSPNSKSIPVRSVRSVVFGLQYSNNYMLCPLIKVNSQVVPKKMPLLKKVVDGRSFFKSHVAYFCKFVKTQLELQP